MSFSPFLTSNESSEQVAQLPVLVQCLRLGEPS
jgi:hypothetical protein